MASIDLPTKFAARLDEMGVSDQKLREALAGTVNTLSDEPRWRAFDDDALGRLLFDGIYIYGATNWEPIVGPLRALYLHWMQRASGERRMQLQVAVRQHVEAGQLSANAFLPFLFLDDDRVAVSTSAIDFAMVLRPAEDDPIGWPRKLAEDLEAIGGAAPGAILGGLVSLGDQRVNELLLELRWLLSDSEIGVAAQCPTGVPYVAAFEFWLGWLEELAAANLTETGLFGQVATGISNMLRKRRSDEFWDIQRNFGYQHFTGEAAQPMTVHGRHSLQEIGERYGPRLYALEAAETPPKVLSNVLMGMGLEPAAPFAERFSVQ